MPLEDDLKQNTSAVKALTEALLAHTAIVKENSERMLASLDKSKAGKDAVKATEKAAADTTPPAAAEQPKDAQVPAAPSFTVEDAKKSVTDFVNGANSTEAREKRKGRIKEMFEKLGVQKASELTDSAKIEKLVKSIVRITPEFDAAEASAPALADSEDELV